MLVDFWAEWCGPCKSVAPIVEAVAEAYAGRLTVAKMDVDANQATPARYGVQGIPTLMLFKGGEREAAQVGALDKSQLIAFIDQNL